MTDCPREPLWTLGGKVALDRNGDIADAGVVGDLKGLVAVGDEKGPLSTRAATGDAIIEHVVAGEIVQGDCILLLASSRIVSIVISLLAPDRLDAMALDGRGNAGKYSCCAEQDWTGIETEQLEEI